MSGEKINRRLLVVDDTRSILIALETKLRETGYEVTSAMSGNEALEALRLSGETKVVEKHPDPPVDLVVLDIMMPGIDGLEVLRRIRRVYSKIDLPVIMATSKDGSSDVVNALGGGANDYVTKPIDIPGLIARIGTQLELRVSHRALREAHRSLVSSARIESVGHLAAGVAHEIRNPLARIRMAAHGLQGMAVGEDEASANMLSIIDEAVERSDSIVRSLMDFSVSSSLELSPGDIDHLLRETLGILQHETEEAGVTVRVGMEEDLPPVGFSDGELRQVFLNLILNAVQAMENGGELTVSVGVREVQGIPREEGSRSGNRLRNGEPACAIEIMDTGSGIAEKDLDSIYDAFFTTRATGKGTGLGLTVARKLIDLHGGRLLVENREDSPGVRVTILLPVLRSLSTTV